MYAYPNTTYPAKTTDIVQQIWQFQLQRLLFDWAVSWTLNIYEKKQTLQNSSVLMTNRMRPQVMHILSYDKKSSKDLPKKFQQRDPKYYGLLERPLYSQCTNNSH